VPILMESVEHNEFDGRQEPHFSALDHADEEELEHDHVAEDHDDDDYDEDEYGEEDFEEDDYDDEYDSEYEEIEEKSSAPVAEPEEVFIINIMAPKGQEFNGAALLDIVLKCGLRYGSMDIFHRYRELKGEGPLLFSMANMVKPGTFDLDAMDEFSTPGISLFMTLPIEADSMQSFDLMVETAQAIAQTLQGELKDEQRSAMTRQTLEHCRQRISDFERKKLFRRPR
jgi:cell division protein ZipA